MAVQYPTWRFHATKKDVVVYNEAEDAALGEGWRDWPYPEAPAEPAADESGAETGEKDEKTPETGENQLHEVSQEDLSETLEGLSGSLTDEEARDLAAAVREVTADAQDDAGLAAFGEL